MPYLYTVTCKLGKNMKTSLDPILLTASFMQAFEETDWFRMELLLAETFQFYGPLPDPFDRDMTIAFQQSIRKACPDLTFKLHSMEVVAEGVKVLFDFYAVHTQTLYCPLARIPPVPATQNAIALKNEWALFGYSERHLTSIKMTNLPHTGILGVLEQVGVEL